MNTKKKYIFYFWCLCNVVFILLFIRMNYNTVALSMLLMNIPAYINIYKSIKNSDEITSEESKFDVHQLMQASTITVTFFLLVIQKILEEKNNIIMWIAIVMAFISFLLSWYNLLKKK